MQKTWENAAIFPMGDCLGILLRKIKKAVKVPPGPFFNIIESICCWRQK